MLAALAPLLLLQPTVGPMEHSERWKFGCASEESIEKIDGWWAAYERDAEELNGWVEGGDFESIVDWIKQHLKPIDQRLMWEFGPALGEGHRLVITAEGDPRVRPIVEALLERAPEIEGWEFYGHRLPETLDVIEQMVANIGYPVFEEPRVRVKRGDHNLIDLTFYAANGQDEGAEESTIHYAEGLFGGDVLDDWIGVIEVRRGKGVRSVPAEEAREAVAALIEEIRGELLTEAVGAKSREDDEHYVWEIEVTEQEDYAARDDLFLAGSMLAEMWSASHSGRPFSSKRFSNHGELFCYVKVDGDGRDLQGRFELKNALEGHLNAALREAGVGATIGSGTGRRYGYVDLALTNVDEGLEVVRRVLREAEVSTRSWVLFFDSIYANEWVGIYDDTPDPPRRAE